MTGSSVVRNSRVCIIRMQNTIMKSQQSAFATICVDDLSLP
jgi:hypothetical protein